MENSKTESRNIQLENIIYAIDRLTLTKTDGLSVLGVVEEELSEMQKERVTRARECGCAEDCADCFQMAWCIVNRTKKTLLGR